MDLGTPIRFVTKHRAKFHEIDPFGHLNVNHYLAYFTENRFTGHRECLNLDLRGLASFPIALHIRRIELDFVRPVLGDDEFTIESYVAEVQETSCLVNAAMTDAGDETLSTCRFHIVCVDKKGRRPTAWPESFISLFFRKG